MPCQTWPKDGWLDGDALVKTERPYCRRETRGSKFSGMGCLGNQRETARRAQSGTVGRGDRGLGTQARPHLCQHPIKRPELRQSSTVLLLRCRPAHPPQHNREIQAPSSPIMHCRYGRDRLLQLVACIRLLWRGRNNGSDSRGKSLGT